MNDLVKVGHVLAPFGVNGALKLFVIGDPGQLLKLRRLNVEGSGWMLVRSIERHDPAVVVQLAGVEGRDAADRLRGRGVYVTEKELPPLPPGEYYYHDLIGLPVRSPQGAQVGVVEDVIDAGHQDLLVVRQEGGSSLVPLQAPYVDVRPRVAVVVDAPPGLLIEPGEEQA